MEAGLESPELQGAGIRSWPKILAYGFVFAILCLLGWGLVRVNAGSRAEGPAPDFTINTFDGQQIMLSELRGQVVVINF